MHRRKNQSTLEWLTGLAELRKKKYNNSMGKQQRTEENLLRIYKQIKSVYRGGKETGEREREREGAVQRKGQEGKARDEAVIGEKWDEHDSEPDFFFVGREAGIQYY